MMVAPRIDLRDEFPSLRPLTDAELSAFLEVAAKRAGSTMSTTEVTAVHVLLVAMLGFGLLGGIWFWGWTLVWLYERFGAIAVIAVISIVVCGAAFALRSMFVTDRSEIARYSGILQQLAAAAECPRCGYSVADLRAAADRPGVVCCPECGLVNPAPITHQSS